MIGLFCLIPLEYFRFNSLILADQTNQLHKRKFFAKGAIPIHWSWHLGDLSSPHCSLPLCGTFISSFLPKLADCYIVAKTLITATYAYQVMAGSGHLQTFRLLRFLRSRNCADGQSSYGVQMAVSSRSFYVIIFLNVIPLMYGLGLLRI